MPTASAADRNVEKLKFDSRGFLHHNNGVDCDYPLAY